MLIFVGGARPGVSVEIGEWSHEEGPGAGSEEEGEKSGQEANKTDGSTGSVILSESPLNEVGKAVMKTY
jgi:hypothetical protein